MAIMIGTLVAIALIVAFVAGYVVGKSRFERNHYGIRKSSRLKLQQKIQGFGEINKTK